MAYSASFSINVTNDGLDKFMQCQSGVAVRKFDDTLWPSGSWNEVWVAFAARMTMAYPWTKASSTRADAGSGQFMIGICRTDGPVYGEISASTDATNQHFMGLYFAANNPASQTTAAYTGSYAYGSYAAYPKIYANGSLLSTAASSQTLWIPFTSGSENRVMFAMRFVTHSVANQWIVNAYSPNGIDAFTYPITASSQVAQFFSQSAWGDVTNPGYAYRTGQVLSNIDRSTNGYFDGVFVGWQQWFQQLHISDVVVRIRA